mmetsp:Transcript_47150/g.109410  ORF Transcript_47150/g.109410 Transcript_47150/m.109410 type:complete len:80 (-) Transcript_47150:138-377(-)
MPRSSFVTSHMVRARAHACTATLIICDTKSASHTSHNELHNHSAWNTRMSTPVGASAGNVPTWPPAQTLDKNGIPYVKP